MQQLQFVQTVLLVLQILVCVGLVAVILLQRSEGGALGMGGGGGGMMTARGAGNLLSRTTAILAVFFDLQQGRPGHPGQLRELPHRRRPGGLDPEAQPADRRADGSGQARPTGRRALERGQQRQFRGLPRRPGNRRADPAEAGGAGVARRTAGAQVGRPTAGRKEVIARADPTGPRSHPSRTASRDSLAARGQARSNPASSAKERTELPSESASFSECRSAQRSGGCESGIS